MTARKRFLIFITLFPIISFSQKDIELNGIHTTYNKYRHISKIGYFEKNRLKFGIALDYVDSTRLIQQIKLYDNDLMNQVIFDRDTFEVEKSKLEKRGKKFEQEIVNQKQTIKKEKEKNFIFLIVSVCVTVLLLISIISILSIRKKNKEIKLLLKSIEHQKQEIIDSIKYAKRIQDASMTSQNYISKNLKRLLNK
ncbi:MAG: hypothetical protein KA163_04050 [Bacteroidia bacterium]|nr:hypothetical protein [Bacteroidia bacterium]